MDEELSAFAAYAAKKAKKKPDSFVGLKVKPKNKLKKLKLKKNKMKKTEVNHSGKKETNEFKKKAIIKQLLEIKKESLFKNVDVSPETDNIFLGAGNASKENSLGGKDVKEYEKINKGVEKKEESEVKTKEKFKKKKRKIFNGVGTNGYESSDLVPKTSEKVEYENKKEVKNRLENGESSFNFSKPKKKKLSLNEEAVKLPKGIYSDSVKVGEEVFSWMLSPMNVKDFFSNCWEQKPLHINHKSENFFKCICTMEDFNTALKQNDMYFTRNIDVTSYVDGKRFTENPEGKAKPSVVWDLYKKGKSIRVLNPQTFIPNIRLLNTCLQEFFQCFVGANIYLTPPGTQGFAPHYDDIEAFVLQLEGEKHWKLYNPRSPEEVLPRESSRNFTEDEIGEPIMEVTLKPGDLLYFPRGIIHQARCLPHVHSLHVTVSCYQKNSWADLLEKLFPVALQRAINNDVEFRKGLPLGYLNHLGMVFYDDDSVQRRELVGKVQELAQKVIEYCPLDAGVDQLGADFVHDALPPFLTQEEELYGADRNIATKDDRFFEILSNSSDKNIAVKLIRATSVRLVSEQDEMVLYYSTDNSLVYHEHEPCSVTVTTQWAQAVDYLIRAYPKFVDMKELPVSSRMNKPGKWRHIVEFVHFLWQKGLLLFDVPVQQMFS